ncbi:MAG: hypothetical protein JWN86_3767 [Planctomycetota bacterium]|nr:hypothetical protein [Planctomycetota bacterium]
MIPMSCPSCGRRGNVPLDRLNTRMHCKKCDAVFHLDATGKPVLGEPPTVKGSKSKTSRPKDEPLDPIGIVAAKLAYTPKPVWMTLLVALGLGVLYYGYTLFGSGSSFTKEQEISLKVVTAARAVLDKDLATLKAMATNDSQDEIVKAVEVFHSMAGSLPAKTEDIMLTPGQPPEGASACVVVDVIPPASADGTPATMLGMDLCWIKGGTKWFIDGKSTLAMVTSRADYAKTLKK